MVTFRSVGVDREPMPVSAWLSGVATFGAGAAVRVTGESPFLLMSMMDMACADIGRAVGVGGDVAVDVEGVVRRRGSVTAGNGDARRALGVGRDAVVNAEGAE